VFDFLNPSTVSVFYHKLPVLNCSTYQLYQFHFNL